MVDIIGSIKLSFAPIVDRLWNGIKTSILLTKDVIIWNVNVAIEKLQKHRTKHMNSVVMTYVKIEQENWIVETVVSL